MLEKRFSINADLIVENLNEEYLISQWIAHDYVTISGPLSQFAVPKELLLSC